MKLKILVIIALAVLGCTAQIMEEPQMSVEVRSQLGNVLLSGNPIWYDVWGGAPAGATQYEILCRIVSTDGALIGSPIIDAIAPNYQGQSEFNIQARVDQAVDYDFEFPQVNKINTYDLLAFDITLEAGERYIDSNGDKQTVWSGVTEAHRILKGGISHLVQNDIMPAQFYDNFIKAGKFLTWQPSGSYASPDQPLMLWYIHPWNTGDNWKLKLLAYYDGEDGFTAESEEAIVFNTSNLYGFNLSLDLWGIDAVTETHGKIRKLIVYLTNAADEIQSEDFVWYFDHKYYEENTYLYYKNSIGGIDCLWCNGKVVEDLDPEKSVATRPDQSTVNHKRGTQVVSSVMSQRGWDINTGYKSKAEIAALRDFVLSDQMWLIRGDIVIPVILEDSKQVMAQISRNLDSIQFTVFEAHKENRY